MSLKADYTLDDIARRFDDLVAAVERIADTLEDVTDAGVVRVTDVGPPKPEKVT